MHAVNSEDQPIYVEARNFHELTATGSCLRALKKSADCEDDGSRGIAPPSPSCCCLLLSFCGLCQRVHSACRYWKLSLQAVRGNKMAGPLEGITRVLLNRSKTNSPLGTWRKSTHGPPASAWTGTVPEHRLHYVILGS
jgi:hypothetical protein